MVIRIENDGGWIEYRYLGGRMWKAKTQHGEGAMTTAEVLFEIAQELPR